MAEQGATDVAALAASTMAVSVSMLVAEGPFTLLGAVIALSILLVLLAYVGPHARNRFESAAMAAVIGILSIPIGGLVLEALNGSMENAKSGVPPIALCGIWAGVALYAALLDFCRDSEPRA